MKTIFYLFLLLLLGACTHDALTVEPPTVIPVDTSGPVVSAPRVIYFDGICHVRDMTTVENCGVDALLDTLISTTATVTILPSPNTFSLELRILTMFHSWNPKQAELPPTTEQIRTRVIYNEKNNAYYAEGPGRYSMQIAMNATRDSLYFSDGEVGGNLSYIKGCSFKGAKRK